MNIKDSIKLMELYAVCPRCGCEVIGNGKGTLECDTAAGSFRRTCSCGWYVEVQEGVVAGQAPEVEVPADEEPDPEPISDEKVEPDPEPEPLPVPISEPKPVQPLKADKKKVDKPAEWRGFVHIRSRPATKRRLSACVHLPHSTHVGTAITRWILESPIWPIPAVSVARPGVT